MMDEGRLRALIPAALRPPDSAPLLDCSLGGPDLELTLTVPHLPDELAEKTIVEIVQHELTRDVQHVTVARGIGTRAPASEVDVGWVFALFAKTGQPSRLETLFTCVFGGATMDAIARMPNPPTALGTYNTVSRYGAGQYGGIRRLDIRDIKLDWRCEPEAFPDLATLILRPRGNNADWVPAIFARPEVMPTLTEVRAPEYLGDEILLSLIDSPLLPQLRCLDFTESLTNRGAVALLEHASKFDHIERLWIATTSERRREWLKLAIGPKAPPAPPLGELEITDEWVERLRDRFGERACFEVRPGHPNLGLTDA